LLSKASQYIVKEDCFLEDIVSSLAVIFCLNLSNQAMLFPTL